MGTAKCFSFHCVIGLLRADGDSVVIWIRSRLWNSTFLEVIINNYNNVKRILSLWLSLLRGLYDIFTCINFS